MIARLVAGALLLAAPAMGRAEAPPCVASLHLEPERALVGQQVIYEVRILRRDDVTQLAWDPAPSFPAFRSEWLPGVSADREVEWRGATYTAYRERRALFPTRAGVLAVPAAGLRCAHPAGEEISAVPGGQLVVEPLPGAVELVGPLAVSVSASPQRLHLGESLRVSVVLRGRGNLWDAPAPLGEADFPGSEVFAHPPELARDAGRSLQLRRYFVYDVVPRQAGRLRVPAVEVAWFDPELRQARSASSPALEVSVAPAPTRPEAPAPASSPKAAPAAATAATGNTPAWGVAAALLTTALAAAFAIVLLRRGRRTPANASQDELARAEALHAAGEVDAACAGFGRVLREALRPQIPEARALASDEIRARAGGDPAVLAAATLLARLERARFEPGAAAPAPDEIRRSVAALASVPR